DAVCDMTRASPAGFVLASDSLDAGRAGFTLVEPGGQADLVVVDAGAGGAPRATITRLAAPIPQGLAFGRIDADAVIDAAVLDESGQVHIYIGGPGNTF